MRIYVILLCVLCAFCLTSLADVDQSFTAPTDASNAINECCAFIGQTYTAGLSGTLAGVSVDISEGTAYHFPLDVQIRTVTGGLPTTTILGETTATSFSMSDIITFPESIAQIAGVQYAIVVDFPGAQPEGAGHAVGQWFGTDGNLYPGGVSLDSSDNGNTWPIINGDVDSHFVTYVNTVPEPASLPLGGLALLVILTFRRKQLR
jgi:hypothetical protein